MHSADYAVARCPSVRLSVCLSHVDILSTPLNIIFLPSGSFYCAMLCKRGLCCHAVSVRPSVCPFVTFVDHVKTNKHIFEIFTPSGSDTILVFPSQRGWRYSDGNPPNGGVECKGYDKINTNVIDVIEVLYYIRDPVEY